MSIAPLKKITLVASAQDKNAFIDALQELGCVHLNAIELPEITHDPRTMTALRFLLETPYKRHPARRRENFDADNIIEEAISLKERLEELQQEQEFLQKRISKLMPWGSFQLPEQQSIGNQRLWFYRVPLNRLDAVRQTRLRWAIVHKDHHSAYVVVISRHEPTLQEFPFKRTLTGIRPLGVLQQELEAHETEIDELKMRRIALTRFIPQLFESLAELETRETNQTVKRHATARCGLISLSGWVEEEKLEALQQLMAAYQAALIIEPIAAEDKPPTRLKNASPVDSGEDLVNFYQTPAYRTWDPSSVLFFSFALFFAMIMADAGYALLLVLLLAVNWNKLEKTLARRRLRNLMAAIGIISLAYGALCNSWFGYAIPGLEEFHLINIRDHQSMIRLSVAIGVLHILLAQAITLWRYWDERPVALHHAGWMLITIGGALYWLLQASRFGTAFATMLMLAGVLMLLLFPARVGRSGRSLKIIAARLMELGNITKLFGDVLSYLRLFALGLASATLAVTFNDLAGQIVANDSLLSMPFAVLVLLLGHVLNFVLTIVSGVVHGLRLNFIEFYHWTLSDEGYPFRAFKKKESAPWNYS